MRRTGEIWKYVNGTSVPNLDATALLSGKRIVIPPEPLLNIYKEFASFTMAHLYGKESNTLIAIRDTLLPKLISGELRVSEAELILEKSA